MRLAVLFPSGHIFDTPCLPNLINYLAKNNLMVDLYSAKNSTTPLGDFNGEANIKCHMLPLEQHRAKENVLSLSFVYFFWVLINLLRNKCDLLVAVGIRGLFITPIIAKLLKRKFVYYSLEIYDDKRNAGIFYSLYRRLERMFHGWSVGTIIQDEARAELISQINNIPFKDMMLFPNAPYRRDTKSSFDVGKFDMSGLIEDVKGRNIVLASGSLTAKWAGISGIIEASDGLPDECVLILQSRQKISYHNIQYNSRKVIVSTIPLSVDQYEELVGQSAIGLAWYESKDRNINIVGLSSGKLAHYLACGKPIIVNRIPFWSDVIMECGCGVVVDDFNEIPYAVKEILSKYQVYENGARKAYDKYYNMETYALDITARLKAVVIGV